MTIRLLSPERKRLYPNQTTGTMIGGAGSLVKKQREGYAEGEGDPVTFAALRKLGWKSYTGPAVTDDRGYIVPGSDPGNGL